MGSEPRKETGRKRRYRVYPRLTLLGRRWFWRFKGGNGEIVASGEGYRNKADALYAVHLLQNSADCPVEVE